MKVVAVAHNSKAPGYWEDRLDEKKKKPEKAKRKKGKKARRKRE